MKSILRKRTRNSSLHEDSSDPPLFSSDDLSASAEDYTVHRSKRLYRGTWWSRVPESQALANDDTSTKRSFKRNFDSGVWMDSDGTEEGDAQNNNDGQILFSNDKLPHFSSKGSLSTTFNRNLLESSSPTTTIRREAVLIQEENYPHQLEAIERVQRCVDEGEENVDLGGLNLGQVSWSTLSPLRQLTLQPIHYLPPSQEAYQSLTPKIHLFLANNELSSLPNELYNLGTITTLSLRQNKLENLSPAIANLTELEELNIGSNSFRFLPWEVIGLLNKNLSVGHLHIHPNPLARAISPLLESNSDPVRTTEQKDHFHCVAATSVTYFDIRGNPCYGSSPAPSQFPGDFCPPREASSNRSLQYPKETDRSWSYVPPLLEQALRVCAKNSQLEQLLPYLSVHYPSLIYRFLTCAAEHQAAGGVRCSVCNREYIIPRTEWVEWYPDITRPGQYPIPFLRRGCSWQCVASLDEVPPAWKNCGWVSS